MMAIDNHLDWTGRIIAARRDERTIIHIHSIYGMQARHDDSIESVAAIEKLLSLS